MSREHSVRPTVARVVELFSGKQLRGHDNGRGRFKIRVDGYLCYRYHIVWVLTHGAWPPDRATIDHINGDRSDDRPENLRLATQSQNLGNSRIRSDNTSGRKGVSWHKLRGRWRATYQVDGKACHLGLFDDIESAHAAYASALTQAFGDFARP